MLYEMRKIKDLKPYEKNARTHSPEQIKKIAASIKEFNFMNPVIIDAKGGIIAGHGRVEAAALLNIEEVPCLLADHLSEKQKKAYILADNRLALDAGWDNDLLKIEIQELMDMDFDVSLAGFDQEELEDFFPNENEGLTDEDAVPDAPETPVTIEGDIWILGNHRLMCGDSTDAGSVALLMDGQKPDLIHTDPPYGMNAVSKSGVLSKNYKNDIMGDNTPDIAKNAFKLIYGLYPDAKHIWWGANYYCSALPDSECWLVWDKNNGGSDQTDCELAWANFRSVVRQFTQSSEKTNRVHPTQKPVSLMEWIIKRFKVTSTTIADFFGGSGSTLIAAEKHGINSFIMEFDPAFCDVIISRWEQFTGKYATLESDGKTFDEVRKTRKK
jgi:DNA modification methylase